MGTRLSTILSSAAVLAFAAATTAPAQAQQLRYSTTAPGGIASTGNTLGLSKQFNANGPGIQDSIGTFLTLDTASADTVPLNAANPWPLGTTNDWTQNGSQAVLQLPSDGEVEVLYAELVWGGSFQYIDDVSAFIDGSVTLSSGNDTVMVAPSAATALTISETAFGGFPVRYYVRSADVTAFVMQNGAGSYAVSGVAATQTTTINSLNAAGWSLVVAYRSDEQPIRNLSIFVGGSFVDEDSQQDYTVSGFCAPPFGVVEGKVVVGALEGDADLPGDDFLIAPNAASTFVNLSGPNNPADNFFCSQINDGNGVLDTQGTFGMSNHDAMNGLNISGGRQGWDLTTVTLSSMEGQLFNGQSSAVVRTNTTGDSFVPALVALEIDVKSPDFTSGSTTEGSKDPVTVGDTLVVTAKLQNSGEASGMNLLFALPPTGGLSLMKYTTDGVDGDSNGVAVSFAQLQMGVAAGTIQINETRTIELTFQVTGAPNNGINFVFTPVWEHSFVVCDGDAPIVETYGSSILTVDFEVPMGTGGMGGMGGAGANGGMGGTGAQGGAAGGLPADDDDDQLIAEGGSCACATVSRPDGGALGWLALQGWLALPGLLALVSLRRRRR